MLSLQSPLGPISSYAGNEAQIGTALQTAITAGLAREELFITTKLDFDHLEPQQVEPAVRASLQRLGLDYLDLCLIHWPVRPDIVKVRPLHVPDTACSVASLHHTLLSE